MFANPEENLKQMGIVDGMQIADLGAGSGAYTLAAARMNKTGHIYAVEVQKDLVAKIVNEAGKAHLTNVAGIWGNIEKLGGTKIREGTMDLVIVSNVLFQVEDKEGFISEVARIARHGGHVLLIDWSESFGGMGPAPEHVMSAGKALSIFVKKGFEEERKINAGAHHYGIIFRKK